VHLARDLYCWNITVTRVIQLASRLWIWPFWRVVANSCRVTTTDVDGEFAKAAGLRIEQASALCSFAAGLVGKARQRPHSILLESLTR